MIDRCVDLGESISGSQYDAARNNWGGTWRMPTEAEFIELKDKCQIEKTTLNGIAGISCKGPNGSSIFLPLAGNYILTIEDRGEQCYYWSGTQDTSWYSNEMAIAFFYTGSVMFIDGWPNYRIFGYPVRAVTE